MHDYPGARSVIQCRTGTRIMLGNVQAQYQPKKALSKEEYISNERNKPRNRLTTGYVSASRWKKATSKKPTHNVQLEIGDLVETHLFHGDLVNVKRQPVKKNM
jgi:hypothetical protein